MEDSCKMIINLIVNGVELENGEVKEFDVLDYYALTNLSYDEFFSKVKSRLTVSEIRSFKRFCTLYGMDAAKKVEDSRFLLNTQLTIGIKYDSKGRMIAGSGKSVGYKENLKIAKYLLDRNIPLCNRTIYCAQKRFLEGTLDLSEIKDVKKLEKKIN